MIPNASRIRESYELVRESPTAIAMLFYGRLFNLEPSLRNLFKNDLRVQAAKLMDTLEQVVNCIDHLDQMRPQLGELGRVHVTYGVQPEHYQTVTAALLWALGQALEADFDAECRAAWSQALQEICREMLAGAALD